jgi:surface antigen
MQQHYAQEYEPSPTTATALQPRQQYTFGENYDNAAAQDDDLTHGAYSEQPQQQAVYNLEAYGDYDSYAPSNEAQGYTAGAHPSVPAATHQDDDPYGGI